MSALVLTPWHRRDVLDAFLAAWRIEENDPRILLREDVDRIGCGRMKNQIIGEAVQMGAETLIVLDSDCHPYCQTLFDWEHGGDLLGKFIESHLKALEPQTFTFFEQVTEPRSRGTPHLLKNRCITRPVACSMGFWTEIGDYDAALQLAYGQTHPMKFEQRVIFNQPFALSGMNMAFRAHHAAFVRFIDVPRYDDIWMGWIFQRIATNQGFCFNLNGPPVKHSRQSNVWQNLREESKYAEINETLWRAIWEHPTQQYEELRKLLPV